MCHCESPYLRRSNLLPPGYVLHLLGLLTGTLRNLRQGWGSGIIEFGILGDFTVNF
jgi:hypothetical protein